MSFPVPAII